MAPTIRLLTGLEDQAATDVCGQPPRFSAPERAARQGDRDYLVTRNVRPLFKIVSRLPTPIQRGFAALLNANTRPFDHINYWGSRAGGRALTPRQMLRWFDRVVSSLHRHLDHESAAALQRRMAFPSRWDPYFADWMSLADAYHYPTRHFDHHERQLTVNRDWHKP